MRKLTLTPKMIKAVAAILEESVYGRAYDRDYEYPDNIEGECECGINEYDMSFGYLFDAKWSYESGSYDSPECLELDEVDIHDVWVDWCLDDWGNEYEITNIDEVLKALR